MAENVFIDNSTLKAVATCDTQALIKYVYGYTNGEGAATLESGTAGHESLATYFRGGTIADAIDVAYRMYFDWQDEHVDRDSRFSWSNLEMVLRFWMETHPLERLPFKIPGPDFVEVGFQRELDNNIILTGRMDAVCVDNEHDLAPIDHKFTGSIRADWVENFRTDSQMTGYMWAMGSHYGGVFHKAYVNAVELSKLPVSNLKCKTHGVPHHECVKFHLKSRIILVERTPPQIEEWRRTAVGLAKRFIRLKEQFGGSIVALPEARVQGMFSGACRNCELKYFCSTGRNVSTIDEVLIPRVWDPVKSYAEAVAKHQAERSDDGAAIPSKVSGEGAEGSFSAPLPNM